MLLTYSELIRIPTFEERFEYLNLRGRIGEETFGFDRYLNQKFYQQSPEWKAIRDKIILRDECRDLAMSGYEIYGRVIIHHMNPLGVDDLINGTDLLLNPEYLITTTLQTHNAIHYGDKNLLAKGPVTRKPGDTCPWSKTR